MERGANFYSPTSPMISASRPPPRPPSSIANTSYYSLDSSTPVPSEFPTPTQSPNLLPIDVSHHIVDLSEHTITHLDMADTATTSHCCQHRSKANLPANTQVAVATVSETSHKSASSEAGPSKVGPEDDSTEDAGPAPRYSAEHKPAVPVSDMKKGSVDTNTKDSAVVVESASSTKSEKGVRSAFGMGPGTSGPAPPKDENETLHQRAATAESGLSQSVVQKITAAELKDAKRVSKILKNEQKAEDRSMKQAIKELDKLASIQRQASKDESAALSAHNKAVKAEHKLNMKYLAAKAAWEKAAADLKSKTEMLNSTREHARTQTELLQAKTKEVDQLRTQKATDDRERQAKLLALKNPSGKVVTK
ncbi:DNA binding protein Ncp1 [Rhizoctonia solani]|uniref:DNA binding protein Ncp1 n=1 Tax=Rhizoctonia solani TaxID=456999 RepID=A0A8H7M3B7_9AGAM|nr:DNA binding protein Ncp1 [Rhizoctonia solani]